MSDRSACPIRYAFIYVIAWSRALCWLQRTVRYRVPVCLLDCRGFGYKLRVAQFDTDNAISCTVYIQNVLLACRRLSDLQVSNTASNNLRSIDLIQLPP